MLKNKTCKGIKIAAPLKYFYIIVYDLFVCVVERLDDFRVKR